MYLDARGQLLWRRQACRSARARAHAAVYRPGSRPDWCVHGARAERLSSRLHEALLLAPHGKEEVEVGVGGLVALERVKRFVDQLRDAGVVAVAQQVLDRVGKGLVEVLGKGGAGIVGQDADEHDGVVLHVGPVVVVLGQEDAHLTGGGGGGGGAGNGGLDDGGQVEDFLAL